MSMTMYLPCRITAKGIEIKGEIIGQSILGGERFIGWIRDKLLKGERDRECPPLREYRGIGQKKIL